MGTWHDDNGNIYSAMANTGKDQYRERFQCMVSTTFSPFTLLTGWLLVGKTWKCQGIYSCQGNVRDFTKSQGNVREKILSGKTLLKLFIVSCIFASIQVFSTSTGMIWVTLNMPSAANRQGISHCLEGGHAIVNACFDSCVFFFNSVL